MSVEGVPRELPVDISLTLYRVTQEALRNVVKHAPESLVSIRVSGAAGVLYTEISDTGRGFDPTKLDSGQGLGLISMQERVRLIGGTLQVRSLPDSGTAVVATVPWEQNDPSSPVGS